MTLVALSNRHAGWVAVLSHQLPSATQSRAVEQSTMLLYQRGPVKDFGDGPARLHGVSIPHPAELDLSAYLSK